MTRPIETARNGRRKNGRFAKGNPGGPGRPRGLDFRRVITEQAEANGVDLEVAIWRVFEALLQRAQGGDVRAARLLLDRLCDTESFADDPPQLPLTEEERLAKINAILAKAAGFRWVKDPNAARD